VEQTFHRAVHSVSGEKSEMKRRRLSSQWPKPQVTWGGDRSLRRQKKKLPTCAGFPWVAHSREQSPAKDMAWTLWPDKKSREKLGAMSTNKRAAEKPEGVRRQHHAGWSQRKRKENAERRALYALRHGRLGHPRAQLLAKREKKQLTTGGGGKKRVGMGREGHSEEMTRVIGLIRSMRGKMKTPTLVWKIPSSAFGPFGCAALK